MVKFSGDLFISHSRKESPVSGQQERKLGLGFGGIFMQMHHGIVWIIKDEWLRVKNALFVFFLAEPIKEWWSGSAGDAALTDITLSQARKPTVHFTSTKLFSTRGQITAVNYGPLWRLGAEGDLFAVTSACWVCFCPDKIPPLYWTHSTPTAGRLM